MYNPAAIGEGPEGTNKSIHIEKFNLFKRKPKKSEIYPIFNVSKYLVEKKNAFSYQVLLALCHNRLSCVELLLFVHRM